MPIVHVRPVTAYYYNKAVGFGEHWMMLRPRGDGGGTSLPAG